jgi:hypothetical protein
VLRHLAQAKHVTLNNSVVDARSAADWMLGN